MLIAVIIMVAVLLLLTLGVRAVYISFFKKKDERSKWIVQSSMAQSFIVVCIFQIMVFVIKCTNPIWWENITNANNVEPFAFSLMVLGVLLVINTKKHGGSI